jgi:hypothetical protein
MTQRTAKIVSTSILVAVIAAFGALTTLRFVGGERIASPGIAVVGDPATPGFAQVRSDLEAQLADGKQLGSTEGVTDVVIAVLFTGWSVTGGSSCRGSRGTSPAGSSASARPPRR